MVVIATQTYQELPQSVMPVSRMGTLAVRCQRLFQHLAKMVDKNDFAGATKDLEALLAVVDGAVPELIAELQFGKDLPPTEWN